MVDKQLTPTSVLFAFLTTGIAITSVAESPVSDESGLGKWNRIAEFPGGLGVAGPFVGVSNDVLIIAGGANFPKPRWASEKVWHDQIHVLAKRDGSYHWKSTGTLPQTIAYGASVTTRYGVVCIGGNNATGTFEECFVMQWNRETERVEQRSYPSLPRPCAYGQAAVVNDVIYLAGGQSDDDLDSAMQNFWSLDLSDRDNADAFRWKELKPIPGASRAFNLTIARQNGSEPSVFVMSGRRRAGDDIEFLRDTWEFSPSSNRWRRRANLPRCVMAGFGIELGQRLFVLGGADGSLFFRADELKDSHPGFPNEALVYLPISNRWESAGPIPQNHVTTLATKWGDQIIIASGEIRPRVRSTAVWGIPHVSEKKRK